MQRISGKEFDITIGDLMLRVSKASLEISDNSSVAKSGGIPDGWVSGDVEASGEMELDPANLALLTDAADAAGSFRGLDVFDILFYAKVGSGEELKVQAFGCKLKVSSLLDIDRSGGEKHNTKIPYLVTSPDFVRINGVPYLEAAETKGLI